MRWRRRINVLREFTRYINRPDVRKLQFIDIKVTYEFRKPNGELQWFASEVLDITEVPKWVRGVYEHIHESQNQKRGIQ